MDIDTANSGTSQIDSSKNLTLSETTQLKVLHQSGIIYN